MQPLLTFFQINKKEGAQPVMGSALVTRDSEHATIMSCRLPAFWVVSRI